MMDAEHLLNEKLWNRVRLHNWRRETLRSASTEDH